jgi:SP family sugar:H+ symporter-like MFS transporter
MAPPSIHEEHDEIKQSSKPVAEQRVTLLACALGAVASIGGFIFGYVRYCELMLLAKKLLCIW